MEILKKLHKLQPHETSEYYNTVVFEMPSSLDKLPDINDNFIDDRWLTKMTPESILEYFKDISSGNTRIQIFNDMRVDEDHEWSLEDGCWYCRRQVDWQDYYYCYNCYINICSVCYKEVDEKIDKKNTEKDDESRKTLKECRTNHKIMPRRHPSINDCMICDFEIDDLKGRYYEKEQYLCVECYEKNKDEFKTFKFIKYNFEIEKKPFYYSDFQSIYNWIPIIEDEYYCHILINLNEKDKNYKKICLQSCDDHGRCGFYILYKDGHNLETILEMLKKITDKGTYKDSDEREEPLCSYHHNSPIQVLMIELGLPVYYG